MNTAETLSKYQQFFIELTLNNTGPEWRDTIVGLVKKDPALFALLDARLRDDEVLLLTALKKRTDMYILASERLRSMSHMFLAAMVHGEDEVSDKYENAEEWQAAVPEDIRSNKALILEATALDEFAFYGLVSEELMRDDDFLIEIGKVSPHALATGVSPFFDWQETGDTGPLVAGVDRLKEAGIEEEDMEVAGTKFLQYLLIRQEQKKLSIEVPPATDHSNTTFKL